MTISATAVRFDDHTMWVDLSDGRNLGVPLAWFPRLLRATPEQREQVEISRVGLHWEEIDEDISIAGLLAGRGDMMRQAEQASSSDGFSRKRVYARLSTRYRETNRSASDPMMGFAVAQPILRATLGRPTPSGPRHRNCFLPWGIPRVT